MNWPERQPVDPVEPLAALTGGGEMGALIRDFDWSSTPVGAIDAWPQSLRTALSILLETGFPMYIAWGPSFTQFYNDGYRPILGSTKHPALGKSTRETFHEIWDIIGPMFEGVRRGRPTTVVDFLLPLDRHGFVEECYFIFSYSPIREESGAVGGVLVTVTETTSRVLGSRRLATLQALAARTLAARTTGEVCDRAAQVLSENPSDVPALAIWLADEGGQLRFGGGSGLRDPLPASREVLHEVLRSGTARTLELSDADVVAATGPDPGDRAARPPRRAVAMPILGPGTSRADGVLVAGVSPRLLLDAGYQEFLAALAVQIGSALASVRALEEAEARAEALAAVDRAKTLFFSNVSHEFRTPLTLMLGPTEEALASQTRALVGADLDAVYRNALRLQKLVNTLLDFSRIESGRTQATYEPTELAVLTADLASAFRSATERAGIALHVDCPPLTRPVWVDRTMWEKIVLNLVSNALKFTRRGSISVSLREREDGVELSVRDTGVGVAKEDQPRIFERFHRVERAGGRTHEGSGIGLALVRELVALHRGEIGVESAPGVGSTFTVRLPSGSAHLASERVAEGRADTPVGARPYVEEALRWLPDAAASAPAEPPASASAVRIVVADDNADMRDYLVRLLGDRWRVEVWPDGAAALAAIRREPPDLVLTDVMMPELGGHELLRHLRADPSTRSIPVILVSARAGEDSRVEALEAGADDYVEKPFLARELVARVQAQLVRAKVQSLEQVQSERLASVFRNAPVGVAVLRGSQHVFEYANASYLELVGVHRGVLGRPIREAFPDLEGQGIYELLDRVYATGEVFVGRSVPVALERKGPLEEYCFDFVYQPLADDHGVVTGIAVVVFEVTELTRARQRAEAASLAKDEFLAMLGHELRNPLAPILTALHLLRLRGWGGAARELALIERQVKHVVGLVDDLLDVSRIARGKVQLRLAPVDLADVVAEAVEMTAPALESRRHLLTVDVPREMVALGDRARLAQVMSNLLNNAAKYTDQGGSISVRGRARDGHADLTVTDTGVGIAPDVLRSVFELFTQERQAIDRSQGGLGLGLAIVRNLVEAHGGTVSAHSRGKGCGAEFRVRLPLAPSAEAPPPHVAPAPVRAPARPGRRVLVVDDNVDAADLLSDSLVAMGHVVRVAYDGPAAIAAARAFQPEVVLLDLGLPVMDGFEVAGRLRADGSEPEIVALSGYGQESHRRRTQQLGFKAHLTKPYDLEQLDAVIRDR